MIDETLSRLTKAQTEEERNWVVTESLLESLSTDVSEAAWAASIPHWFNVEILAALQPKIESKAEHIYQKLQDLSFVEVFSKRGHNLHESTRQLMLAHLWSENPIRFQQLSLSAANYFAHHNNQSELQIEWLYHLIIAKPNQARAALSEVMQEWINTSRTAEINFLINRFMEHIKLLSAVKIKNSNQKQELGEKLQTIIEELIDLIESSAKKQIFDSNNIASKNSTNLLVWRNLRNKTEKMWRRTILLKPDNLQEFQATLMWMAEKGTQEELDLIVKVKNNPPYTSKTINSLWELVENRIQKRLKQQRSNKKASLKKMTKNYMVQFKTPVLQSLKQSIEDTRAKILQPLSRLEVIVSIPDEETVNLIKNLEEVLQVTPYVPKIRVKPQYLQNLGQPATREAIAAARLNASRNPSSSQNQNVAIPGIFVANFFTPEDRDCAAENLETQGIPIANKPGKTKLTIDLSSDRNSIESLKTIAGQIGLQSLGEKTIPKLLNSEACQVIAKGVISSVLSPNLSLTGKGEIIAIADTGLDTGESETLHLDFGERVNWIQSYPIQPSLAPYVLNPGDDDGASDIYTGHGTHIAGSALGSGEQAKVLGLSPIPQGIASEAELVFQAIEQTPKWNQEGQFLWLTYYQQNPPNSGLFGIPDDLEELFEDAYNQGARIHSNSWGSSTAGIYEELSQSLDQFVWDHKDFLVLVAAGDFGKQSSSATKAIDQGSITSPGTAKNGLTVGASENKRYGQFTDTYGYRYPEKFPYSPFNSDGMVDSVDDIAAFSGRGPCEDGRCKPDVIAPGTFILSTRSSQIPSNNFDWGAYPPAKDYYMYSGGTSSAAALVAGCAALVRQYLKEIHQPSIDEPSAALVKGILIHSAQYIKYRFAHPDSAPWVDNEQGWGRVDLQKVLAPAEPTQVLFIDEEDGLKEEENREYQIEITDSSVPLRATLVYTDYPGEYLINNLNLVLHSPSGKDYLGNDFQETGEPDTVNNVEGVVIKSPEIGKWTVEIIAEVIGSGVVSDDEQDYALVISGGGLKLI